MDFVKVNINNRVKVKLTEHGKLIHKAYIANIYKGTPIEKTYTYCAPKEDGEGYSTWQLWELMNLYGPHLQIGVWGDDLPFATNILVEY